MKYINELVNGGLTTILLVVMNLVCVRQKGVCPFFGVTKGHGNTFDLKLG